MGKGLIGIDAVDQDAAIIRVAQPGRLVLDRSFVSELVYGPLHHGGSCLTDTDAGDLTTAYERVVTTLAPYLPVIRIDTR